MAKSPIQATVSVKQSKKKLEQIIASETHLALKLRISKNSVRVEKKMRQIVAKAIRATPEYNSLLGGKLQSELGVVSTRTKLREIIDVWVKGLRVNASELRLRGVELQGSIQIGLSTDFQEIINLPAAKYVTEKGVTIEWLRWLLLEGDKIIVINYTIVPDDNKKARTKLGEVMRRYGTKYAGWNVPPEFSGIISDNFITRAMENVQPELINLLSEVFR